MKQALAALVIGLSLIMGAGSVQAKVIDVATCSSPKGWVYYNYSGVMPKNKSGWQEDAISKGVFTIKKLSDNTYDILVKDSRGALFSLNQDGGKVMLVRYNIDDVAYLHYSIIGVVEIYNIFKEKDGNIKFSLIQNKGFTSGIGKSSVMIGDCSHAIFP